MTQKIIIISGGRLGEPAFYQKRLAALKNFSVICCDGGIRHSETLQIKPDIIIGDMDSATADQLASYQSQGVKILKYPQDKDDTDTQLAINYALELKPEVIEIWGALGGRLDHTLANLSLLSCGAKAGIDTRLVDEYCEAFVVYGEANFTEAKGQAVSLFAYPVRADGITLRGFQYSLDKESLDVDNSRCISNVITASPATISFDAGSLLVIRYWQKNIFPEAV
jgi:thiamine pyrophosphokinase